MTEKTIKADVQGIGSTEGVEVKVTESTERWTELKLEDGTALRVKPLVTGAMRIDGRYDPEGNPIYALKVTHITVLDSVPSDLRKKPEVKGVQ